MKPLRRSDLDAMKCATPGCGCPGVVLRPLCHFTDRLRVEYDRETGDLMLFCSVCNLLVSRIAVASGEVVYQ